MRGPNIDLPPLPPPQFIQPPNRPPPGSQGAPPASPFFPGTPEGQAPPPAPGAPGPAVRGQQGQQGLTPDPSWQDLLDRGILGRGPQNIQYGIGSRNTPGTARGPAQPPGPAFIEGFPASPGTAPNTSRSAPTIPGRQDRPGFPSFQPPPAAPPPGVLTGPTTQTAPPPAPPAPPTQRGPPARDLSQQDINNQIGRALALPPFAPLTQFPTTPPALPPPPAPPNIQTNPNVARAPFAPPTPLGLPASPTTPVSPPQALPPAAQRGLPAIDLPAFPFAPPAPTLATPVNPTTPATPVNPSTPATPVNPSTPATPVNPSTPVSPNPTLNPSPEWEVGRSTVQQAINPPALPNPPTTLERAQQIAREIGPIGPMMGYGPDFTGSRGVPDIQSYTSPPAPLSAPPATARGPGLEAMVAPTVTRESFTPPPSAPPAPARDPTSPAAREQAIEEFARGWSPQQSVPAPQTLTSPPQTPNPIAPFDPLNPNPIGPPQAFNPNTPLSQLPSVPALQPPAPQRTTAPPVNVMPGPSLLDPNPALNTPGRAATPGFQPGLPSYSPSFTPPSRGAPAPDILTGPPEPGRPGRQSFPDIPPTPSWIESPSIPGTPDPRGTPAAPPAAPTAVATTAAPAGRGGRGTTGSEGGLWREPFFVPPRIQGSSEAAAGQMRGLSERQAARTRAMIEAQYLQRLREMGVV
jgi:hypothetical protein